MPVRFSKLTRSLLRAGLVAAFAAIVGSTAEPAPASAAALAAPRPGMARIWIYREYEPYISLGRPYVRINGAVAGISEPGGAFYRDVPPGHYDVTVDSDGVDVYQFAHGELVAGEVAYLKVEVDAFWASAPGRHGYKRDTFYVRPQLPQVALAQIARMPFYGGA